jgi:hypothetical protein
MTKDEFNKQVKEARKRVESFDDIDGYKDRHAKTILFALEAGIMKPDTGAQFDAYVMLQDVVNKVAR